MKKDFNKVVLTTIDPFEVMSKIPYGVPVEVELELDEGLDSFIAPESELRGIRVTIRRVSDGHPETPFDEWADRFEELREHVLHAWENEMRRRK